METIERFLSISSGYGSGDGSGSGSGDGSGSGSGYGDGYGYGYGDGSGYGDGYDYGYGDGSGYGDGYDYGYGYGYGSGDGSGYGSGYGDGIKSFNGNIVYEIDDIQTLIYSIKGNYAKGAILNNDLTLSPCYIAKVDNYFAHGTTLKDAVLDATNKAMQNKSVEDRIQMFKDHFKDGKYPAKEFAEWHRILTGSCQMGVSNFMANHGIKNDDPFTVADFILLTKNDYGGDIIKRISKEREVK